MQIIYYIFLFLFGACFGSLGSVLIWRLKSNVDKNVIKSILFGRSQCPFCQKTLGALELFPIFSWIFQGGKCKSCKTKISSFYPWLEICTGIMFMFTYWFVSTYVGYHSFMDIYFIINFFFVLFVNYILLLLLFADILFYELNVLLWILLIIWTILWQFLGYVGDFKMAFVGGISFFIAFYFIYYFSKFYVKYRFGQENSEGFGEGDVMVGVVAGLMLPFFLGVKTLFWTDIVYIVLYYLIISAVLGIIFSLFSRAINKGKYGSSIPFLPAMIVAFWIMQLYGVDLVRIITSFNLF